jgi:hypothetical protein
MHLELRNRLPFGHRHSFLGDVIRKALIFRGLTVLAGRLPFGRRHRIWEEVDAERSLCFFSGVGIGMGLMYLLDPDRGSHRRTKIKDAAVHSVQKTGDAIGAISRGSRVRYEESMGDRLDLH